MVPAGGEAQEDEGMVHPVVTTGGTLPVNKKNTEGNIKVANEQQEDSQMIREIDEEEIVGPVAIVEEAVTPAEIAHDVGDELANAPLMTNPDTGEEEKRDVVKMNSDDSVMSS